MPDGNLTALTIHGLDGGQGPHVGAPAAAPAAPQEGGASAPAPAAAPSAAPALAPVTLDALAAQVAEAQSLLGQLAAAGVPLDRSSGDVAPLATVQAAASIQSDASASTLRETLASVLGRLEALVAQLREQHAP